jgi:hypothetical protein
MRPGTLFLMSMFPETSPGRHDQISMLLAKIDFSLFLQKPFRLEKYRSNWRPAALNNIISDSIMAATLLAPTAAQPWLLYGQPWLPYVTSRPRNVADIS